MPAAAVQIPNPAANDQNAGGGGGANGGSGGFGGDSWNTNLSRAEKADRHFRRPSIGSRWAAVAAQERETIPTATIRPAAGAAGGGIIFIRAYHPARHRNPDRKRHGRLQRHRQ